MHKKEHFKDLTRKEEIAPPQHNMFRKIMFGVEYNK